MLAGGRMAQGVGPKEDVLKQVLKPMPAALRPRRPAGFAGKRRRRPGGDAAGKATADTNGGTAAARIHGSIRGHLMFAGAAMRWCWSADSADGR